MSECCNISKGVDSVNGGKYKGRFLMEYRALDSPFIALFTRFYRITIIFITLSKTSPLSPMALKRYEYAPVERPEKSTARR